MKKVKFTLLLVLTVISFVPVTETKAQSVSISFSTFQQQLSPYGKWMHNPRFGEVWIYNDAGFKPYYSMVIGNIPITVGPGNQIMIGVGHHFIMAVGNMIPIMAGCGYLDMSGHRPGLAGAVMRIIMAGHHLGMAST